MSPPVELPDLDEADPSLTAEGWPRPIINGWPVPWVSPSSDLSKVDAGRLYAVVRLKLCQVCGEGHEPGARVYFCVDDVTGPIDGSVRLGAVAVTALDEAVMHERCARLALGRCPRLHQLYAERRLLVVSVGIDEVCHVSDEDGVSLGASAAVARVEAELSATGRGPT